MRKAHRTPGKKDRAVMHRRYLISGTEAKLKRQADEEDYFSIDRIEKAPWYGSVYYVFYKVPPGVREKRVDIPAADELEAFKKAEPHLEKAKWKWVKEGARRAHPRK